MSEGGGGGGGDENEETQCRKKNYKTGLVKKRVVNSDPKCPALHPNSSTFLRKFSH